MSDDAPVENIASRTVRGMVWAYGSYMGERVVVVVLMVVLARLLTPEDFGLVALALVFITLLETIADLGLGEALVISGSADLGQRASTAFTLSLAFGATLAGITALAGGPAAAYFDEPSLRTILPVLGLLFVIRSAASTHYAIAQRRLDFRSRTAAELSDVVVRGATSVALAAAGHGVWSLVGGYLAGEVARAVVLWVLVDFSPKLHVDREHAKGMLRYGGALSALSVLAAVIHEVDNLFVGRVLGTAAVGLYSIAFDLPELAIVNFSVVAGRVLFPAFAAVDPDAVGRAFLRALHYTLVVAIPLAVVLAICARSLVEVAFGDRWLPAVPAMRMLILYAVAVTVGIPAGTVYKATGRVGLLLALAVPRSALVVLTMALFVDDGITAVAASQAGVAGTFALIGTVLATRILAVRPVEMLHAIWAPLVAGSAAAAAIWAAEALIASPLVSLVAAGLAGAATYLGALFLVSPRTVLDLRDLALERSPRDGEVVDATGFPEHGEHGMLT